MVAPRADPIPTPRYEATSVGVSAMIARTIESVLMPSASPSKFRMTRWRSAGAATAWTSAKATLNRPSSSAWI
jgi:hypothetical protein